VETVLVSRAVRVAFRRVLSERSAPAIPGGERSFVIATSTDAMLRVATPGSAWTQRFM
jgi:hypothetical protein